LYDYEYCEVYVIDVTLSADSEYVPLNDRVTISLYTDPDYPTLDTGRIKLEAISGSDKIRVWDTRFQPEQQITLPKTWLCSRGGGPDTLEVEGITTSNSVGDVELKLSYIDPDWNTIDSDTVNLTVVKVEITEPDENPATDNNFAFNSESPGACPVTATGTTGVSSLNADLEWTLTAISGSTQTSNPDPAKGPNITFTYTTLPSSNSEFGEKTLTMMHPNLPADCNQDTQTVEIFFHRDAYNHTGEGSGSTRNWYYYWKEGSVVSDMSSFGYQDQGGYGAYYPVTGQLYVRNAAPTSDYWDTTFTNLYYQTSINSGPDGVADTTAIEDDVQIIAVGYGEPNQTAITAGQNGVLNTQPSGDDIIKDSTIITGPNGICNTTASGDDVQVIPVGQGKPYTITVTAGADNFLHASKSGDDELDLANAQNEPYNIDVSGIDCCAVTCVHELKHKELCEMSGTDSDGDDIPDSYELASPYHLDPYRADTYDCAGTIGYGDDNEFLARMAENNPGSTNPSDDWSDTNGKQWGQ